MPLTSYAVLLFLWTQAKKRSSVWCFLVPWYMNVLHLVLLNLKKNKNKTLCSFDWCPKICYTPYGSHLVYLVNLSSPFAIRSIHLQKLHWTWHILGHHRFGISFQLTSDFDSHLTNCLDLKFSFGKRKPLMAQPCGRKRMIYLIYTTWYWLTMKCSRFRAALLRLTKLALDSDILEACLMFVVFQT